MSSGADPVDEGTETFTILSGMTAIGSAVTVNVGNRTASADYVLPAAASAGTRIKPSMTGPPTSWVPPIRSFSDHQPGEHGHGVRQHFGDVQPGQPGTIPLWLYSEQWGWHRRTRARRPSRSQAARP